MKIRYRILESRNELGETFVIGVIYTGFSTSIDGTPAMITERSFKETFFNKALNAITLDDIPGLIKENHSFNLYPIKEIDTPDNEEEDWSPYNLIAPTYKQEAKQRKTA